MIYQSGALFADLSTQRQSERGKGAGHIVDYTGQKETAGKLATFAWIGSGLYLYLTTHGASLFSWSALGFFAIGMFAAALVFGIAIYALQRGITKILVSLISSPTRRTATTITVLGWALLIAETVLIFFAASLVFHQIEPARAVFPVQYISDRNNFNGAMKAFADANKLDQENTAGRDSGSVDPANEAKMQGLIEMGLERGRKVSDEFLAYLDPELPQHYHVQLIQGHELLLRGRQRSNVIMQGTGIELLRRFYQEFFSTHGDAILKKLN